MHLFFSGIGGAGIGPLALIAHEAGYKVSGSDKQNSLYVEYLKKHGVEDINIGQTEDYIASVHSKDPIDWYVYSSSIVIENPKNPEILFCKDQAIKMSRRDELLNHIITTKHLKLIAIAGTHGKSTTTAMVVWLFKKLNVPLSYSIGAKIYFDDMGKFDPSSEYFVYEADEFDRNFLSFEPFLSLISGVTWDHHEIFPTREDYQQAFSEFISQSAHCLIWSEDQAYLGLANSSNITGLDSGDKSIQNIKLAGQYNRLDAFLAITAVHQVLKTPIDELIDLVNDFPGLSRRMEKIVPGLYTDYAHTPEKIRAAMSVALEMAASKKQNVIVVYEPLTDRRQHYILDNYKDCFNGAKALYWLDSYLAREDDSQAVLSPVELISHLDDPSIARPAQRDDTLLKTIKSHLEGGDMVVCMSGGGGNSLDEWLRQKFGSQEDH